MFSCSEEWAPVVDRTAYAVERGKKRMAEFGEVDQGTKHVQHLMQFVCPGIID